jgi:hypothetical protein
MWVLSFGGVGRGFVCGMTDPALLFYVTWKEMSLEIVGRERERERDFDRDS